MRPHYPEAVTSSPVRVRFAPSPTGYLHVGGARTVLFNWLFARHSGGEFVLRIEDTDTERNRPELIEAIFDSMRWLGLDWDGEPVYQSHRFTQYRDAADSLMASGRAYFCDCKSEDVQARTVGTGGTHGYDGYCRERGLTEGEGRALRFRTPDSGSTGFDDLVRGRVTFENSAIEDFVLLRSSGTPTFLLANIIDDSAMGITHVVRGEEHVNGTPKYLLIGEALDLGYRPIFAHLPLLVNEQRKKLSKRRDDVSVGDFRERGYLPEAMVNYLTLLGWGPPDGIEVRPVAEFVKLFELGDVNPSPAFFDVKKLTHINGEYLRALSVEDFVAQAIPFLTGGDAARDALVALAPLVQERVKTFAEVNAMIEFLWLDEPTFDEAAWDKHLVRGKAGVAMLDATLERFDVIPDDGWLPDAIEAAVLEATVAIGFVNDAGRPQLAKTQGPVRVAVTGRAVGPPLWESLTVLGRERTLERLHAARLRLT